MSATANAKLNLALRVMPRGDDGYHPIRSLSQTVDWFDRVSIEDGDEDRIVVSRGSAPEDETNLAWVAAAAVRTASGSNRPMVVTVAKSIPAGSGLGGGSADAAAALILASRRFGVPFDDVRRLAVEVGADVPFALVGGTARVAGAGELIAPIDDLDGFAVAVVVPDLELDTAQVYAAWDALDGPEGPIVPQAALPPQLRELGPLGNDLYPAAITVAPDLDDWRAELEANWGVPVAMTGSGSGLFAYFTDREEAAEAVGTAPASARAARAVEPIGYGWRVEDE